MNTLGFFLNDKCAFRVLCDLPLGLAKTRADFCAKDSEYTVNVEDECGDVLYVAKAGRA